jgi:hypothetical protein
MIFVPAVAPRTITLLAAITYLNDLLQSLPLRHPLYRQPVLRLSQRRALAMCVCAHDVAYT